jgi:hypothetical protein
MFVMRAHAPPRWNGGILLGPSSGIEAGILLRNPGTGPSEPGIEGGAECFHPFHFPGGGEPYEPRREEASQS